MPLCAHTQDKAVVLLQRAYARHTVRRQAREQLQQIELQRIRRFHSAATDLRNSELSA
jgi:hypothetical protein